MANTGLLLLSNIKQLGNTLKSIDKLVSTLYIQINVPAVPKVHPLPTWGRLISQLYIDSHDHLENNVDLRILVKPLRELSSKSSSMALTTAKPIDILFSDCRQQMDVCNRLQKELRIPANKVMILDETCVSDIYDCYLKDLDLEGPVKVYNNVVLGGTFDRIHEGHKIMLTQAMLRTNKRLVVGVTTSEMIKSKTLFELILPIEKRMEDLREFLTDIDPTIQIEIVPISDPLGPTKVDPNMDLVVVSQETIRGGEKINAARAANGLKELDVFCIEIVEYCCESGPKETKVSSSNKRIDLLGTRLRKPEPRTNLPDKPYIIGLTGGIASGKSRIAEKFERCGAFIMDCDKIAHEVYEPGQPCYYKIIEHFGEDIVNSDKKINRPKLGNIVFSNPEQLEKLNSIVWPELLSEVKRRIAAISPVPRVVVIEAAVLLKAGWENECHEIWSMIVPFEEAVVRIMERNKLTREQACKRLESQMPNLEIVSKSNVVFSSQWDDQYTDLQAQKAWEMLMNDLDAREPHKN